MGIKSKNKYYYVIASLSRTCHLQIGDFQSMQQIIWNINSDVPTIWLANRRMFIVLSGKVNKQMHILELHSGRLFALRKCMF